MTAARPTTSRDADPRRAIATAAAAGSPARRERVRTQDLTPELLRDWLDDACFDAALDEDDDILVRIDDTRVRVRLSMQDGLIMLACSIALHGGEEVDEGELLRAANGLNACTTTLRIVVRGLAASPGCATSTSTGRSTATLPAASS